jgi:hypothetical protein
MSSTFRGRLREAEEFFMGRGKVHQTMDRITKRLAGAGIPYAIIGGMAINAHGLERVTTDVDLLTTREGLDEIHKTVVGLGFVPNFPGARKKLKDTTTGVDVEFITTGEYPGDGKPKPVVFPDPRDVSVDIEGISVISLDKLIELKLASGLSAPHRVSDIGDVARLIQALKLPRELGEKLDASVRDEYYRLWDASQNVWHPSDE